MVKKPFRLTLAQSLARILPLVAAQRVASSVFTWAMAAEGFEIEHRALTGSALVLNTRDELGLEFANTGCYDWKIWAIALELCDPGDTIVEVGANVGTETVGFADIVGRSGRVIAFEPVPNNVARLQQLCMSRTVQNIELVPCAVSDVAGTLDFVFPEGRNSGLGHIDYGYGERPGRHLSVDATTLDTYLEQVPARLLVMDVEGAEPMVLNGGRAWIERYRPAIVCEAHHHKEEIHNILTSLGYAVYSIARLGLVQPELDPAVPQANWLAIDRGEPRLAHRIERMIRRCGIAPSIRGLNPLVNLSGR